MQTKIRHHRLAGAVALAAGFGMWISCGDPPMAPTGTTGTLEVSVTTTGGDRDEDGYDLTVDGDGHHALGASDTVVVVISDLEEGSHEVELSDVAANCATDTMSAPNPRPVTISIDDTTRVAFKVHCLVTGVLINTQTSGADPDSNGYTVSVDGAPAQAVAASGTLTITRLSAGMHTVALGGVADHCEAADRQLSVTLAMGEIAPLNFAVSCVALTASVQITATTSGADLDANGYTVEVRDNGTRRPLSVNGSTTIDGLPAGEYTLWLDDVAANCTVGGLNPRTFSVTTGDATRDTARTAFEVTCVSTAARLEISAATSGAELDPDGYTVYVYENCDDYYYYSCERITIHQLGVNDVVTIEPALIGYAWVWLQDVARNCSVDGATYRETTVASTDTARVAFSVTCVQTGSLQVDVATTGIDPDQAYSLSVHGTSFDTTAVVAANATLMISRLPPGDYSVTLDDVALNCDVNGPNPTTANVSSGGTAVVGFDVVCASLGSLQLTAITTGVDLDSNGYTYRLQGERFGRSGTVAANETVVISGVPGGDYEVTLDGVAANCDLSGPNPTTVSVPSGGTAAVAFDVSCAQAGELAVSVTAANGNTDVYRVKVNGTGLTRLTTHTARDAQPAWSPDGSRIAFASTRDGSGEIYVMNGDGSGLVRLTASGGEDAEPAWSPDGSRIAFRSNRPGNSEIYVMNADGTNPIRLTRHPGYDSDPAWSPDGSQIAFASNREGNDGIYVMSADGSGVTRLTSDGVQPAWSPDGSRLAFSRLAWCYYGYCEYALYVMNADGSGVMPLNTPSAALGPAWSADGRWIAYGATLCSDYYCYNTYTSVHLVQLDGGRIAEVLRDASEPAFRP